MMNCWKCQAKPSEPLEGELPFRACCSACSAWLHCCRNCRYFSPGKPNQCLIPHTELVVDREAANFCEDFKQGGEPKKTQDLHKISLKLFKDELEMHTRKSFNDLWDK